MGGRSISDVAAEVGLGVHTIRYYEQAGLIPPVPRDAAGRRVFDEQSRDWLAYAACLRALGMPVALVAEYVAITALGTHDAAHRGNDRGTPRRVAQATRRARPLHRARRAEAGRPGMNRPRHLAGTEVSSIALGTMNFGGRTPAVDAHAILDRAVDRGVRLIDTANVYGHDPADFTVGRGRSEEIIGAWLRTRPNQGRPLIATKLYFPMPETGEQLGATRPQVRATCEASLRRLGVDTIDLYQLHHPSNTIPIDETLDALTELVAEGKIRWIGTSSFAAWQVVESLWASDVLGNARVVSEQPVYNLLDRRIERELAPMAATYDVALLTWSPLAGGALTDTYQPDTAAPPDSRFAELWRGRDADLTTEVHAAVAAIRAVATELGTTTAALAHAWLLHRPEPTCVLIGPRTLDQLDAALGAAELRLTGDVLAELDRIAPPGRCVLPQYGADGLAWEPWGPHRTPWRRSRPA